MSSNIQVKHLPSPAIPSQDDPPPPHLSLFDHRLHFYSNNARHLAKHSGKGRRKTIPNLGNAVANSLMPFPQFGYPQVLLNKNKAFNCQQL